MWLVTVALWMLDLKAPGSLGSGALSSNVSTGRL
ncbi:hypothetical protein LINPERHAP2_LOCUS19949 [Linum perenne]